MSAFNETILYGVPPMPDENPHWKPPVINPPIDLSGTRFVPLAEPTDAVDVAKVQTAVAAMLEALVGMTDEERRRAIKAVRAVYGDAP